jgi:hypothetical protein
MDKRKTNYRFLIVEWLELECGLSNLKIGT